MYYMFRGGWWWWWMWMEKNSIKFHMLFRRCVIFNYVFLLFYMHIHTFDVVFFFLCSTSSMWKIILHFFAGALPLWQWEHVGSLTHEIIILTMFIERGLSIQRRVIMNFFLIQSNWWYWMSPFNYFLLRRFLMMRVSWRIFILFYMKLN